MPPFAFEPSQRFRKLVECMVEGARRFGWASRREGRLLVGYGMAAAMRMHFQQLSTRGHRTFGAKSGASKPECRLWQGFPGYFAPRTR